MVPEQKDIRILLCCPGGGKITLKDSCVGWWAAGGSRMRTRRQRSSRELLV